MEIINALVGHQDVNAQNEDNIQNEKYNYEERLNIYIKDFIDDPNYKDDRTYKSYIMRKFNDFQNGTLATMFKKRFYERFAYHHLFYMKFTQNILTVLG